MPSPVPVEFGKYQLLERLAVGGMAELYRARFEAMAGVSKPVVIKKILPAFAGSESFVRMFVNEARIAVSLSHGNIAQVFDFGEIDGDYFLAMEYVHGQPLSRVLRRAHALQFPFLPEPIALQIGIGMCRGPALRALPRRRARALAADRPPRRLAAERAARLRGRGEGRRLRHRPRPQRHRRGDAGHRGEGEVPVLLARAGPRRAGGSATDLYATGVVLYQMLCGRLPHLGKMVPAMQSIIRGEFPAPRSLNPRLSPELDATLLQAMAYAPADRFASAQEMEHALADALHALGPAASVPSPTSCRSSSSPSCSPRATRSSSREGSWSTIPEWRKGPQHSEPPEAIPSLTTAAVQASPPARSRPWQLVALLGVALVIGTILAAVLGRVPTFELELRSEPTGARVEVDGTPVPGTTPMRITHLAAEQSAPGPA